MLMCTQVGRDESFTMGGCTQVIWERRVQAVCSTVVLVVPHSTMGSVYTINFDQRQPNYIYLLIATSTRQHSLPDTCFPHGGRARSFYLLDSFSIYTTAFTYLSEDVTSTSFSAAAISTESFCAHNT